MASLTGPAVGSSCRLGHLGPLIFSGLGQHSRKEKVGVARFLEAKSLELVQCHLYHIILVKARQTAQIQEVGN